MVKLPEGEALLPVGHDSDRVTGAPHNRNRVPRPNEIEQREDLVMHTIRVGTCGWSYQDWSPVFYPEELPAGEYLSYYAERYPIVEVDSTFYHTPSRKLV